MIGKRLSIFAAAGVLVAGALQLQAAQITGGISFAGGYLPNNANLLLATQIEFHHPVLSPGIEETTVASTSGDFTVIPNTSVVQMATPLAVNPTAPPVAAFWSVLGFSMNVSSLIEIGNTTETLTLLGQGTIMGPGFDPTPGQFIATFNTLGGTFSWSASNAAFPRQVPDGGATAALLGLGILGMATIRRRLS